jgi:hypothetical protein
MKKDNLNKEGWTDKAAEKIARTGINIQTGFANKMNRVTRNISLGRLKFLLVIFCLTVGGYSVYLFGDALFSSEPNSTIKIQQLRVLKHASKSGDETLLSNQYVDEDTYRQVIAFKRYMDSLKIKDRPVYDSVVISRPGLLDTVQILIEAYEQFK